MKKLSHRLFAVLLAAALLLSLPPAVRADDTVVYDASQMPYFQRTPEQVAAQYNAVLQAGPSYVDSDRSTYYDRPASTVAPYDQGVLSQDTLDVMVAMGNYLRWLTGADGTLEPVSNNDSLQRQALIRCFSWNHRVDPSDKPDDMDQAFWDAGAILDHNILAWYSTPRGAMQRWCNEGYSLSQQSWDTIGHRMAIIEPALSRLELGYAGITAIGKEAAFQNSFQNPFIAFPAPGPMPLEQVGANYSVWSVSLNPQYLKAPDLSAVTVTITDGSGVSIARSAADDTVRLYGRDLCFVQPDCGASTYPAGSCYTVRITGLKDASGSPAELRYQVCFFSLRLLETTTVSRAVPTPWTDLEISEDLSNDAGLAALTSVLPTYVNVFLENGARVSLPLDGGWTLDSANSCWTAQIDASSLTPNISDPDGILTAPVQIRYTLHNYNFDLVLNGSAALDAPGALRLTNQFWLLENYELYQIFGADEDRSVVLRADDSDMTYDSENRLCDFTLGPWSTSDSGTWFCVCYYDAYSYYDNHAYVSSALPLEIVCPHTVTETQQARPTCTEDGYKREICTRCGAVLYEIVLPSLGHAWGAGVVLTPPSAAADGVRQYTCSVCGETMTFPIPRNPFEDVAEGKFYFEPVLWAYYHTPCQITAGTDDTHFSPKATCTRGQVVTFLWNAMGKPEPDMNNNPFVDLKDGAFYYKAVLWAYQNGVTSGVDSTHFAPKGECTRAQVVTFLWNAMGNSEPTITEHNFVDVKEGKFYYKAMLWAVEHGITSGVDETHFAPSQTCTRGQVVTFLYYTLSAQEE